MKMDKKAQLRPPAGLIPCNQRKAQFYLIAALVIIAILIGFVTVSNVLDIGDKSTKVYDLSEELNIESAYVLDYGTYQENDEAQMRSLMTSFTESYTYYDLDQKSLYFVFGNKNKIVVAGYTELITGTVNIDIGSTAAGLVISDRTYTQQEIDALGQTHVEVNIFGEIYGFELTPGENFYFVISQEVDGDRYVVQG